MSKKPKYKLVEILWIDSVLGFQGWKQIKEQKIKPTKFISVGYLVKNKKNYKHIFPHLAKRHKNISGTGDIIIPTCAILKMRELG